MDIVRGRRKVVSLALMQRSSLILREDGVMTSGPCPRVDSQGVTPQQEGYCVINYY